MHQFFWWSFPIFAVLLSLSLHAPTQIGTTFLMKPMFFCMPLLYIDNECIHYACLVELLLGPYMHKWYSSKKKKREVVFFSFSLLPCSLKQQGNFLESQFPVALSSLSHSVYILLLLNYSCQTLIETHSHFSLLQRLLQLLL